MKKPLSLMIDEIVSTVQKMQNIYNKADAYRRIKNELNSIANGSWTYPYIANLHRGDQIESASDKIKDAIKKLHKKLHKNKAKPKPDYRLRPLQCLCTEAEYQEMIQASTRERTEKNLHLYSKKEEAEMFMSKILRTWNRKEIEKFCFHLLGEKEKR